jgi:hypothetical protein
MVGTDGQLYLSPRQASRALIPRPLPPALTIHGRGLADSLYSRGERGEDVVGGPLWSPVRCLPGFCITQERKKNANSTAWEN